MNVEIVKGDKNEAEIQVDNVTIAEVLRVYLAENGADFAAWKREHPSKPAVLKVKTSKGSVSKAVADAVAAIKKDADALLKGAKK